MENSYIFSRLLFCCLIILSFTLSCRIADDGDIRIALVSDIHYADKPNVGNRHYIQSLEKARLAMATFNENEADFLVLLGDNIDEIDKESDLTNLKILDELLGRFNGERHYVLGNHDLGNLTKEEFLAKTGGAGEAANYSFSRAGYHFIVLDPNFRQDGTEYSRGNFEWTDSYIPSEQRIWLKNELELSRSKGKKVIIFIHQILCDTENEYHGVKNNDEIRAILEQSGNVTAVFQGHYHHGIYKKINGIHYVGIHPMVVGDTNAFAELTISREGKIELIGYGRQPGIILRE